MSEGDTIPLRGSADMWRSRAGAAEAENQRLQAEVARLRAIHNTYYNKPFADAVSEAARTATEAALRWAWGHRAGPESAECYINRGSKALLGEGDA